MTAARFEVAGFVDARLRGWSVGADAALSAVRVLANGRPATIRLQRIDRPDVWRRLDTGKRLPYGFIAELDPSAWRLADARGRLAIRLEIDGRPAGVPQSLSVAHLARWAERLRAWRKPDEREVWRLLAHVAAAGGTRKLAKKTAAWLTEAASARGLAQALATGDASGRLAAGARPHLRIDNAGRLEIDGWASDPVGELPGFALHSNGQRVALDVRRDERPELRRALDAANPLLGFHIEFPVGIWAHADAQGACAIRGEMQGRPLLAADRRIDAQALRDELDELRGQARERDPQRRAAALRRLALLQAHAAAIPARAGWNDGDAAALGEVAANFESADLDQADAEEDAAAAPPLPPDLRFNLEGWDELILHGWVTDAQVHGEIFTLTCNGVPLECFAARTNRVDVSKALGVADEFLGFEIQVPAVAWRHADARGDCALTLRVNGHVIGPPVMHLDALALDRAVAAILPPVDADPARRFAKAAGMRLRMTALPLLLEHIQAHGGVQTLSPAAQALLLPVAEQLAIADMLGANGVPLLPDAAASEALSRRRRTWRLQRLLNAAIERRGGALPGVLDAAIDEILADPDATGSVRTQLLLSIVPLCVGDAAFARLVRELPGDVLAYYAETGDNWALCLHVVFLAQAGEFELAAAQFARIAEEPARGWLNTECLAAALRFAIASAQVDAAGLRGRGALVQAFVRLLARMPGDAWSRLQDRQLVDAAADLLASDGPWPDALVDDAVRTVLRCYALVPDFWVRLGDSPGGLGARRVRAARADIAKAREALQALERNACGPALLADALDRLHRHHVTGQRDAMQWMRELMQSAMATSAGMAPADRPAFDALLRRLPDLFDAADLWRFELFPGAPVTADVAATLSAPGYRHLLQRAVDDLALLSVAAAAPADAQAIALRLLRMLPALCTAQNNFAGVPLLVETARTLHAQRLPAAGARDGLAGDARATLRATWPAVLEGARAVPSEAQRGALERALALLSGAAGTQATPAVPDAVWDELARTLRQALPSTPAPSVALDTGVDGYGASHEASLWPTAAAPTRDLASGDNRLRLLSPRARLPALADAPVLVVCVVRNERHMLPHFCAHYRGLGATRFVFIDNLSDDGSREWLLAQDDVVLYSADTDYRDSHFGVSWQQAVLAAHAGGKWALVADADEFLLYPGCETMRLPALLADLDAQGHDAARTLMVDTYPRDALRDVDFSQVSPAAAANWFDRAPLLRWHIGAGMYSNGPTWLSALRHRLIPFSPPNAFTAQKLALFRYRPWMRLSEGLHYVTGVSPSPVPLFFGHYKYHAGFREKVLLEIERKQHFDGASEYAHYLAMVAEPDATLFAPDVSVRLDGSASLPSIDARHDTPLPSPFGRSGR